MSKSSGEFLRLQLLVDKGYHPLAYRLMCLQAHYRSELEFSWENLGAALTRLKRMIIAIDALKSRAQGVWRSFGFMAENGHPTEPILEQSWDKIDQKLQLIASRFDIDISDDLITPQALTKLEEVISIKRVAPEAKLFVIEIFDYVLGLNLINLRREDFRIRPKSATIEEADIERLLEERALAKGERDYATSDALRDELAAQGVEVMDGDPLGWEWKLG
jgi:cysteinyl-tRNA synthetase